MLSQKEKDLIKFYDKHDTKCPPCDNMDKLVDDLAKRGAFIEGHVLDVGCGHGRFSRHVASLDFVDAVVGIDYSGERIKRAKKFAESEGLDNVTFIEASVYDFIQDPIMGYNTIAVYETLEHLERPRVVINGLKDMLIDGGVIVGSLPINHEFKAHLKVWRTIGEVEKDFPEMEILDYRQPKGHTGNDGYIIWVIRG